MATGTTYSDREFLFRLQTQIIDGGTDVLRNIFDQKLQKVTLNVFLGNEQTSINRLHRQNTITKAQYELLFPPGGQPPNSAHFDITLIICLLRNLKSLGLNRKYKWNTPPQPTDISVEADLCRLKGFRNEIAHISSTSGFTKTRFLSKWIDIEQVLLRLDKAVPFPVLGLKQILDSYKHSPLEPAAEKRIQAVIHQWREMEKGLSEEMQLIKTDVTELRQDVTDVVKNVKEVKGQLTIMSKDVKDTKHNVEAVQGNITEVKIDVTKVKDNVEVMSREVKDTKNDVGEVQGSIREVKDDVTEVKHNVKIMSRDVKDVTQDVEEVQGNIREVKDDVTDVKDNVEIMARDVKDVKNNVEEVQRNIREVKDDLTDVKDNVEIMTRDVQDVKNNTDEVQGNIREVKDEVTEVKSNVEIMSRDVKDVKTDVEEVQGDIREVKDDVREVKDNVKKVEELISNQKETKESDTIKDLQDDLISFYRAKHRTISLSPLVEEETPLLEFYVMPDIYSFKVKRTRSGVTQEKTAVTPLRNLFYNNDKMCRNIYLRADAGLGKTALSRRLTLAWCHANRPNEDEKQYFSAEEIQAVNEFHFVFLLLLRDSSSECDIDDFIMNQIISTLGHDYTRGDLVNILCTKRCLVILDGLDEWSHPSNSCKQGPSPIPHQKVRERIAFLTTTRPWKLSVSGLQSSQIDQKLDLGGLNPKSANALKESVISHFFNEKNEYQLRHEVKEFTRVLKEKHIADLEAIPLLLMYLLFLWCNKIELGQTQCDLYSQITELLLSRTVQNWTELAPEVGLPQGEIPQCFSGNAYCMQFFTLLTSLGQLAYQTLFREKREENTLVFDGSVAEQYLTKDCLNFCLKTGLLTQSKVSVPGTLLKQKSKVSFAHKTMQEFFAALYMHSTSDQTSVPEIVLSKCKCIKDILEMSKILKFICGMNVNVSSLLSREMMKIINEDEITLEHRNTLYTNAYSHPLKYFQDMCISCCKEIPRENEVSLCLQDVFIDNSCQQEQYRENLKQLTTRNKQNIRSLNTNMDAMSDTPYSSVQKVIDYFALSDLENIEKIYCDGCEYDALDSLPLLKKSVKCLYLSCREGGYWSRNLNTFKCGGLKSPVAIETMLETLRLSVNVERVKLLFTKLGNSSRVFSSEMVNMNYVQLVCVTMTASVLQGIVDLLQQLPQTVTVEMWDCDIKPESEFVKVKQKIKTSREHFRILEDSWRKFKFEIIKQGD